MTRTGAFTFGIVAACLTLTGAQAGIGQISGRVIDGTSNEPVPNATVTFSADYNRTKTTTQADGAGRFAFEGVPAGRLTLYASKEGLVGGYYGQRNVSSATQSFDLAAGERATDVDLRMWQKSSIAGEVRDVEGRPIPNVEVTAHSARIISGRVGIETGRMARTDSDGRYLIRDLYPASYVVSVAFGTAPVDAAGRRGGGGARALVVDYPRVFYPAGLTLAEATTIEIGSGEARTGVNVSQQPQFSVAVTGKMMGRPDGSALTVELFRTIDGSEGASGLTSTTSTVAADGSFVLPRVTPGRYVARVVQFPRPKFPADTNPVIQKPYATGFTLAYGADRDSDLPLSPVTSDPTLVAELPFSVGTDPIADLVLALQEAGRIRGTIAFEGAAAKPSSESLLRTAVVVLDVQGRNLGMFRAARIEADGSFATAGLPPGIYSLMFMPGVGTPANRPAHWLDTWRQREMTVDGQRSAASLIELGATDAEIAITMTDEHSVLQGLVRDVSGRQRPDASILIVQADRKLWTMGAAGRVTRPDRRGGYDIELAPGDYLVTARVDVPSLWSEASSLDQLMRNAVSVHIARGDRRWQDLVTSDRR